MYNIKAIKCCFCQRIWRNTLVSEGARRKREREEERERGRDRQKEGKRVRASSGEAWWMILSIKWNAGLSEG